MAATRKTRQVREGILSAIRQKKSGFTDRLPSYRDLARDFGVSPYIVFCALRELEREGVVTRHRRKGARVVAQSVPVSPVKVQVLICEKYAWQILFWNSVIERFENLHPEILVRPHFAFGLHEAGINLKERADENWIVIRLEGSFPPDVPTVDLREIFSADEATALLAELKPHIVQKGDWHSLPYQLQPPALVYRHKEGQDPPAADWTWRECIAWLRQTYGTRCINLPHLGYVLDSCRRRSVHRSERENGARNPGARDLAAILLALSESQVRIEERLSDDTMAEMFYYGRLGATVRTSFTWPALGVADPHLALWPLPVEKGSFVPGVTVRLAMTGSRPCEEAATWVRFMMSDEFQLLQMQKGFGLSPRVSCREQVLAKPGRFPSGLHRIIEQLDARRLRFEVGSGAPPRQADAIGQLLRHMGNSLLNGRIKRSSILEVTREALSVLEEDGHDARKRRSIS